MPFNIDPDLPVPLGIQLRGVIEYGIVCGQLQPGERLPPVRSMARQLGIAPMTVSQVYKELKEVGLLETKQGNGTFVSQLGGDAAPPGGPGAAARASINCSTRRWRPASPAPISPAWSMPASTAAARWTAFPEAAASSSSSSGCSTRRPAPMAPISAAICPRATGSRPRPSREIAASDLARRRLGNADLVLTLFNRKAEVAALAGPKKPVLGVHYIPSERTRTLLAQIDPAGARSASSPPSRNSCPS